MKWIDAHVHLFSNDDPSADSLPKLPLTGALCTPDAYLSALDDDKPEAIVVVHYSKAEDSSHVIAALDLLASKTIPTAGVIKADPFHPKTYDWLDRGDVKGVRYYALDEAPDLTQREHVELLNALDARGSHVLLFGKGKNLLKTAESLPESLSIVIDHFGMVDPLSESLDLHFLALLDLAASRKNVYFKGPGYRSSLKVSPLAPILSRIIDAVGYERVILGASDAPFAGQVPASSPVHPSELYSDVMSFGKVRIYTEGLAHHLSTSDEEFNALMSGNARALYRF